jgi:hypothetical protein
MKSMNHIIQKLSLVEYSACFVLTATLFCATGTLRAQELRSSTQRRIKIMHPAAVLLPSVNNKDSDYLKTEPISVKHPSDNEIIPSQPILNASNDINYSWTSVDSFSTQFQQDKKIKSPLTVAQQVPSEISQNENPPESSTQNSQNSEKDLQKNTDANSDNRSDLPSRFYIGPDFFRRDYSEKVKPLKSDEFGTLYGLQATYDYVKGNSIYFGFGFRYGAGQTTYDGSLFDGTPFKSKTDNNFLNLEGRLGYTFQPGGRKGRFFLSPFVGLGYHHWSRNVSGNGTTPVGQLSAVDTSEGYSWGYAGPGFHAEYKVSRKFDIGLNAKMMFMFGGALDYQSKFQGQLFSQGNGALGNDLQYEIELPLTFHLVDKPQSGIDLKITPYYRSQDIGRGPAFPVSPVRNNIDALLEPASNTSVYGVTAGIQFRF